MKRDFSWGSDDNFEIFICTFNDNRNGYLFVTNPNGAMADVWVGDEGKEFNKDWDGVWNSAVSVTSEGWFAEIVIPFSTLKFKDVSEQIWGINFERNIRRKKEQLMWQGWSRLYELEKISKGGKLIGLKNIKQGNSIEIKPFILGGLENKSGETSDKFKIGGEINYDITPTLKLNFTLNTDFAQVESDRKQINLSRFSLYYPEKRQFFLDGKNYFDVNASNLKLFYSRRIGIEKGQEIPILGGVKLFGKLDKTNIGIMSIQTNSKDSILSTNYSVIKINQDIFKQSNIGFIITQKYNKDRVNRVYGANFNYSTSELFGNKNLIIGGFLSASDTHDSKKSENINKNNLAYNFYISYPNDEIEFDFGYSGLQKGYNSEMGYARRKNFRMLYTELQFNPRFENLPFFRNLVFKPIDIRYYLNDQTGKVESVDYEWRPFGFTTLSGERFEFNVQHSFDNPLADFELIDGVIIPAGEYWDNKIEVQFETFRGRNISLETNVTIGKFYTGRRQEYELNTNFNLNKHLNISLDWQRNNIQLPGKSFTTDEIGGRIDYAFNPNLQTSVFAQWNNEDESIIVNYRLNWLPKLGSYFYFVINQEFNTSGKLKLERTTILGKLIWRFVI